MVTTARLQAGDIVRFGNLVTGYRFGKIIKKEKAFKARSYFVTIEYAHGGTATEVMASNTTWVVSKEQPTCVSK